MIGRSAVYYDFYEEIDLLSHVCKALYEMHKVYDNMSITLYINSPVLLTRDVVVVSKARGGQV